MRRIDFLCALISRRELHTRVVILVPSTLKGYVYISKVSVVISVSLLIFNNLFFRFKWIIQKLLQMTIPEMDICLNITTNVVNTTNVSNLKFYSTFDNIQYFHWNSRYFLLQDNKKKKDTSSEKNAKKPKREKLTKTNRSLQQSDGLVNKPKTRIKQKSLAAIVAKQVGHNLNKKKVNFSLDKKTHDNVNLLKNNKNVTFQSDDSKEKLDSQNIVQFVKNKNENEIKATVVRKRNVNFNSEKKSLSAVFSTNSEKVDNDDSSIFKFGNLSKNNNDDLQISASNFKEKDCWKNKKNFHEQKELKFDFKRNKQQNDRQNKKFKGKDEHLMNKSSGKISSLFGNNPEVPNIGQRYVKPVQENVFSGINFSDLDIHPYSVCIFSLF